ncbi:MAG: hypothetical protein JXA74_07005, partial [Anaerolineae bacterium]|nr:hypothetical protein [Anaerolineae bacterium]
MDDTSPCLLAIDIGGTALKVALFSAQGELLGLHEAPIPLHSPHSGWAEVDPQDWGQAVTRGVRAVLVEATIPPQRVAGIGLSNMIGTVAPLDAEGRPLRRAIAYFDTRSASQVAWMQERAPHAVQVTGNRLATGNTSLASVLWIREHEPDIYAAAEVFAQTGSILFRWLTGETRVDWTNASFYGLYDYRRRAWSGELAEAFGFDLARVAPVMPPHFIAPLCADVAASLDLRSGLPVALGGLDGAMASLGVGAIHPGDAFDVSGTSEMIAVCLPEPVAPPELLARWHVVPEVWVLIGAISTPGAAWQWLGRVLYPSGAGQPGPTPHDALTQEAAASPPGANGVVFLPHMMGERAPIWDPHARGVFFGLSLSTTRGDMIRAVMEGAAYAMRHLLELIEGAGGVPVQRVVSVGGASRNALWRRIKADV